MLFDSHCHLNFPDFENNYREIIADCLNQGIGVINIGADFESSKRAIEIANEYLSDPVYASIGLYPAHISETEYKEEKEQKKGENFFDSEKYQKLIDNDKNKKIVAVGEIGLEYSYLPNGRDLAEVRDRQKKGFIQQLNFAIKNNLPIILHARDSKENPNNAYEDLLKIIQLRITNYGLQITGVLHCFSSNLEIAQKFIDFGFYLGFTGIITFKNKSVDNLRKVVKMIPLDKILLETDAPYLSPEPYRGEKNTPQNVRFVAEKIAELKNVGFEEVRQQTTENVKKLFGV